MGWPMHQKILVIEDNEDLANLLKIHLQDLEYHVELVFKGDEGLDRVLKHEYDLVILDLMLPGVDGFQICRKMREKGNHTPILMLTSKSSEIDRVLGLELGADDYVTKPFSIRELLARVKAIFRRMDELTSRTEEHNISSIHAAGLMIDHDKRNVSLNGKTIDLTAKEFDLIYHFARNPGKVYTRSQLLDIVWGYGHDGYDHTVNSHINRLRSKIEKDPAHPEYILTVWGVGYKFRDIQEN